MADGGDGGRGHDELVAEDPLRTSAAVRLGEDAITAVIDEASAVTGIERTDT